MKRDGEIKKTLDWLVEIPTTTTTTDLDRWTRISPIASIKIVVLTETGKFSLSYCLAPFVLMSLPKLVFFCVCVNVIYQQNATHLPTAEEPSRDTSTPTAASHCPPCRWRIRSPRRRRENTHRGRPTQSPQSPGLRRSLRPLKRPRWPLRKVQRTGSLERENTLSCPLGVCPPHGRPISIKAKGQGWLGGKSVEGQNGSQFKVALKYLGEWSLCSFF